MEIRRRRLHWKSSQSAVLQNHQESIIKSKDPGIPPAETQRRWDKYK